MLDNLFFGICLAMPVARCTIANSPTTSDEATEALNSWWILWMCLTTWTVLLCHVTDEHGALIQALVGMEEPVPIEEENLPQLMWLIRFGWQAIEAKHASNRRRRWLLGEPGSRGPLAVPCPSLYTSCKVLFCASSQGNCKFAGRAENKPRRTARK